MNTLGISTSWLTVNRACNMRCKWCYAEGADYRKQSDMPLELAKDLIIMQKDAGVESLIFLGGEPLLWKNIFQINDFARENDIATILITNGALLAQEKYFRQLQEHPFDGVSISLKAADKNGYIDLTQSDTFEQVCHGMKNLSTIRERFEVSITLGVSTADCLVDMVKVAMDNGATKVVINFCVSAMIDGKLKSDSIMTPNDIVNYIVRNYAVIQQYTSGNIAIQQSLPFCIWPTDFIEKLKIRDQIYSGCQLLNRSGLVIDSEGSIIPCNCLHDCKLGKYGKDFFDIKTFFSYWNNDKMVEFYDQIIAYPTRRCIDCKDWDICGGGCPVQWFTFDPELVISLKE